MLVVKRGESGASVFDGAIPASLEQAIDCPGFPVEVFNVLGAGDGFMAGLLFGWLRGKDWRELRPDRERMRRARRIPSRLCARHADEAGTG